LGLRAVFPFRVSSIPWAQGVKCAWEAESSAGMYNVSNSEMAENREDSWDNGIFFMLFPSPRVDNGRLGVVQGVGRHRRQTVHVRTCLIGAVELVHVPYQLAIQ